MSKEELINLFLKNGILKTNRDKYSRLPKWNQNIQKFKKEWGCFSSNYRSEEEAWYCLIQGIEEIPKCAICEELCKFNIKEKYYSSVCINHNANAIPEKRKAVSTTKKSFSPEKIQSIVAARRKTN